MFSLRNIFQSRQRPDSWSVDLKPCDEMRFSDWKNAPFSANNKIDGRHDPRGFLAQELGAMFALLSESPTFLAICAEEPSIMNARVRFVDKATGPMAYYVPHEDLIEMNLSGNSLGFYQLKNLRSYYAVCLAHEYRHVWQGRRRGLDTSSNLEEGMMQMFALEADAEAFVISCVWGLYEKNYSRPADFATVMSKPALVAFITEKVMDAESVFDGRAQDAAYSAWYEPEKINHYANQMLNDYEGFLARAEAGGLVKGTGIPEPEMKRKEDSIRMMSYWLDDNALLERPNYRKIGDGEEIGLSAVMEHFSPKNSARLAIFRSQKQAILDRALAL